MNDCNCNQSKPCRKAKFDTEAIPSCEQTAVIPSLTVDNIEGLKGLSNVLVKVTSTNSVYYVDSRHAIMQLFAGPVTVRNYDGEANPLNLRNQFAYDKGTTEMIFFDANGEPVKTW